MVKGWYHNLSDKDIVPNQVVSHGERILGVADQKIAKGESGWIIVKGVANVKTVEDWYDKNDLDSILGVK